MRGKEERKKEGKRERKGEVNELALSEALTRIESNDTEVTRRVNDGLTVHRRRDRDFCVARSPRIYIYIQALACCKGPAHANTALIMRWSAERTSYFLFRAEYLPPISADASLALARLIV